jgi:Undecaprenyl-phosphate galactose phosphotransferase WbaP
MSNFKKLISLSSLIFSDLLVIFLSFSLAFFLRAQVLPEIFPLYKRIGLLPFSQFINQFYFMLVWLLVFAYEKLYTKRFPFWEEARVILKSATISSVLIMIAIFLTRSHLGYSRTVVTLAWIFSLVLFPLFRVITKKLLISLKFWKKKLIIIGFNPTGRLVVNSLMKNKTMGYDVLGFIDDDSDTWGKSYKGIKVIGSTSDLDYFSKKYCSKDIMIIIPPFPHKKLRDLLNLCESISESMWIVPQNGDFITEGVDIENLGETIALFIKRNLHKPWNIAIKNLFDILLTLVLITLLLPFWIVITIAIKLNSKGPFLYRQKRIGRKKETFKLFKFRSMYVDNETRLNQYLDKNPAAREEWNSHHKLKNHDPRVTGIGKIIRKFSLDELPQFFNVLWGNMSLVGPRPYLPEELTGKIEFIELISRVKPGMTGLWQISGRSDLTFEERMKLDEYYIRNWSLWLDIVILLKSARLLYSSKGAY